MKTGSIFIGLILVAVQSIKLEARAQGTFLSNLGQTSSSSLSVADDSWVAASFLAGTNSGGYMLNSIQLFMSASIGTSTGFTVSVNDNVGGGIPGGSIGGLTESDPQTAGVFSYSSPGIFLQPATQYHIVVSSGTVTNQGAFKWRISNSSSFTATDGWSLNSSYLISFDHGTPWGGGNRSPMQFAINATAIPEPSSLALLGLGGLCLASRLKRRRQLSFQLFTDHQRQRVLPH
jgi:hypothetical protein